MPGLGLFDVGLRHSTTCSPTGRYGFCPCASTADGDALKVSKALLCKFPGEIAEGNGKRQIVIDERADDAQRTSLETIISGEACEPFSNHFSVFGSLCTEFFDTLVLPIELEVDLERRTAKVDIPGVLKSAGRPIINKFNGEPFHIAIARPTGSFEFTYGEIGRGTVRRQNNSDKKTI